MTSFRAFTTCKRRYWQLKCLRLASNAFVIIYYSFLTQWRSSVPISLFTILQKIHFLSYPSAGTLLLLLEISTRAGCVSWISAIVLYGAVNNQACWVDPREHRTHQARSFVDPYCRCQGTELSEEGDIFSVFSGDRICRTLTIVSNAPLMFSDENRRALICNFLYKSYFQHSLDGCLTEINK